MMKRPTKKQALIALGAVLLILAIVWGFWPKPISVSVATARIGPLEVTVEEEGITRVKERYQISAPAHGYLLRLQVEVGDTLTAGQTLAQLLPAPDLISARQKELANAQQHSAKLRLKQSRQQLAVAEEQLDLAEKEYQRVSHLMASDIGTQQQMDRVTLERAQARAQYRSAEFSIAIAEYEVRAAQSTLATYQSGTDGDHIAITTPISGQILAVYRESEGIITMGSPIVEVGLLKALEIRSDVLSTDAVQLQPGTEVRIKRWGPNYPLAGVVRRVEPSGFTRISALGVEEQRVPVIVDIVSPQEEWMSLGDGFRVVTEFLLWQGQEVLQVPSSALFKEDNAWALFVMENNRAKFREVAIGHQSGLFTEITEGIREGERVLSHPDERIEDGIRITVRE
jgi:HlyD family secretion protein